MLYVDYRRSFFYQDDLLNTELHYYRNHVVIFFQSDVFLLIPPEKGKLKNTLLREDGPQWRKLAYLWVDEITYLFKVLSFTPNTKSASLAQKRSLKKIHNNGIEFEYVLPKLGALVEKTLITNNTLLTCNYKGSEITHASGHWLNVNHQGAIEYGLRRFGQCIKHYGNPLKFFTEDNHATDNKTGLDFSILAAMMNSHYSFNQMNDFQRVAKTDADLYLNRHQHVLNLAANLL
jgi:hypothetical protein